MSKSKQRNPQAPRKQQPKAAHPPKGVAKEFLLRFFGLKSILVGIAGLVILCSAISNTPVYSWVWNTMMVKSWKLARKFPDTTLDQRYRMKLGFLYTYYMFIKDHTSENAIILFPNPGQIFEGRKDVDQRLTDKYCLTYFLYPRNVVMKGEVDNPLMGKVTHVAIASGHGYEDLGYETSNKPEFTVIPKR